MGRTLVLAIPYNPHSDVGVRLENAWVELLGRHGIDVEAWSRLRPGVPEQQAVIALVEKQFDTVLVARVVDLKRVEREIPASQVAIIETRLYDGASGKVFWLAHSDTYLLSHEGGEIRHPREGAIREYVEVISREMSTAGVF